MNINVNDPVPGIGQRASQFTDHLNCHRRGRLDHALSFTVGTRIVDRTFQRSPDPLTRHFDKAEFRHLKKMRLGPVSAESFFKSAEKIPPVLAHFHIDKIDDHDSANVTQTKLPRDLMRGFQVILVNRIFKSAVTAGKSSGVHVDRNQALCLFNHDMPAGFQKNAFLERSFDFLFDIMPFKKAAFFFRKIDIEFLTRHINIKEAFDLLMDLGMVHRDLVRVLGHIVTDHTFHKPEFRVDQSRRFLLLDRRVYFLPET